MTQENSTDRTQLHVAPGPHLFSGKLTTRRMMLDVLIALTPAVAWAIWQFRLQAAVSLVLCVGSCLTAEWLFMRMRGRKAHLCDLSAAVTGVIFSLSLPAISGSWNGWYVPVIGSFVAIGVGKVVFGSLGQNIFNPAMVGRAFVMIAFSALLGASVGGYVQEQAAVDVVSRATPMTLMEQGQEVSTQDLFFGTINGSLGEVSAWACLLGGGYLLLRRTASWEIPFGVVVSAGAIGLIVQVFGGLGQVSVLDHLLGGSLLFGAFFIATDPVSSPVTPKGKVIFGLGVGALIMTIRLLSSYPEGVMFSILLMNAVVPLINRWTVPRPVGGPAGQQA
jgi:electron transport complex protein RnfD